MYSKQWRESVRVCMCVCVWCVCSVCERFVLVCVCMHVGRESDVCMCVRESWVYVRVCV